MERSNWPWVWAVLCPIIGFILGIIVAARGLVARGAAIMAASIAAMILWGVVLYGIGQPASTATTAPRVSEQQKCEQDFADMGLGGDYGGSVCAATYQ